jgi:hypothetical protein
VVTQEESLRVLQAFRDDPRIQSHFRTLVDCSRVETLGGPFGETRELVDFYRSEGSGPRTARVAFYTPRRDAVYGALRQFEMMAGGHERQMCVFTDMAEARMWIGLPGEEGK